ncbi:MAG TPA: nucleotidyltransferase family protein [Gammaproteobacteria bacterium]|nr:nucleotidyltransferase family protein [Gammaproteobacteria bacterium]
MKAMILAAGRGERMRPLTDSTPKPLLEAGGKSLIEHHLANLKRAGLREIVINLAWLGQRIRERLGDGAAYGVTIRYSDEGEAALETAGGIIQALPLLGTAPFLVINGDIWTDYPLGELALGAGALARLVMIDNPPHHPRGDFALERDLLRPQGDPMLTYSGIGLYRPELFASYAPGRRGLREVLNAGIVQSKIEAVHYRGRWSDIGTPERLEELRRQLHS